MARKIKIDNAILKRQAYQKGKRQVGKRKQRKYILIVCEGEKTEPHYFEAIKNRFPQNALETYNIDIEGTGTNTLKVVEIADKLRKSAKKEFNRNYDEIWAVFDKDSFRSERFNNAIFKAKEKKIHCAWSNEAFELWYILHFQYRNTAMSRQDYKKCLETEISKKISEQTKKDTQFKYKKNSKEMYHILKTYGNEEQAIEWAKELKKHYEDTNYSNHNPCTTVYALIERLNEIMEQE